MRNALCSRGGRLLELLRTANMNAQRKASPSESCTQCLTKRAHGTHRYPAGPRSVLQQQFVSALLMAVVAGAHVALVAALLLHRQAFRTPPEVLPITIAVSLVSPPQSTPPPVSAPVPTAPPPPEPATPVAAEPPPTLPPAVAKAKLNRLSPSPGPIARCVHQSRHLPRRPCRLRLLRRRLRHWQGLRRQPPRRPRRLGSRRITSVTPPRPIPGYRGSAARRDR
jgi:hypothetical protein